MDAEYRNVSALVCGAATVASRTALGGCAGIRVSRLHPAPHTSANDRATSASDMFDLGGYLMALLLTQRSLKISSRTPIGKNRLMVLAFRLRQGRLLL